MRARTIGIFSFTVLTACLLAAPGPRQRNVFNARLVGDNEVPPIYSDGKASFHMEIASDGKSATFSYNFSGLSSNLVVSHLHFGPNRVAGGVMVFLCGGGNQPACPAATSGTIDGTITSANVVQLAAQGIAAGDIDTAFELVRSGLAYANMHTTNFPGGEIRGQVGH